MIAGVSVQSLGLQRGERVLFADLSFELAAGQALAVTGPNGAGKTSLLRAVAGLLAPLRGRMTFRSAAGTLDPEEARHRHCHLVGHENGLDGARSAGAELAFQIAWTGGSKEDAAAAAERLGLSRLLSLDVRTLSAGQRRRLALARLIAVPRDLWLLDEPFAGLDAASRVALGQAMAAHLGRGGLVLAALHEALPFASTTIEIGR